MANTNDPAYRFIQAINQSDILQHCIRIIRYPDHYIFSSTVTHAVILR